MIIVDEDTAEDAIGLEDAIEAVERAFVAAASDGFINPVVIGRGFGDGQVFSIKSGASPSDDLVGLKIGSYWPGAERLGLPRHASYVLLLDVETGRVRAMVEAGRLNRLRTAAADASAVRRLARQDARTLGVIGAGHQAASEIVAVCAVTTIDRVLISARTRQGFDILTRMMPTKGLPPFEEVNVEECCRSADILVTATPSTSPLFCAEWIRPGTHISAMGADQLGKAELPVDLMRKASLYCDLPSQSLTIGEFQRIREEVAVGDLKLTALGDVIRGGASGRHDDEKITIFDSSGLALQDLCVAQAVIDRVRQGGHRPS